MNGLERDLERNGAGSGGVSLPIENFENYRLLYPFPSGQAGAYTPTLDDCVIADPAISFSSPHAPTLDANGYLYGNVNYGIYLEVDGMPARGAGPRIHRAHVVLLDGISSGEGIQIRINMSDTINYWTAILAYTGSTFNLQIFEVNDGTSTQRAFLSSFSPVGLPAQGILEIWDIGDSIAAGAFLWETDTTGDFTGGMIDYHATNRFNKSVTKNIVGHNSNPGNTARIRDFMVVDLP